MNIYLRDGRVVPWTDDWPVPAVGHTVMLAGETLVVTNVEYDPGSTDGEPAVVLDVSTPFSAIEPIGWSTGTVHRQMPLPVSLFFIAVLVVMVSIGIWKLASA